MFAPHSVSGTTLFVVVRLAPLLASLSVGSLQSPDPLVVTAAVHLLLLLFAITGVWYMIEGLTMVWLRARDAGAAASRGYGFVAILGTLCLCALLPLFREYGSQGIFLLTLVTLSLRGMSRAGWERGRPHIALLCSLGGATSLAMLSFLVVSAEVFWQQLLVALAFGSGVAAVEASWFSDALRTRDLPRWVFPLIRADLYIGPLCLGTLGLFHQLPKLAALLLLLLPLANKILERIGAGAPHQVPPFRAVAGYFVLMVGCLFGSAYW